MFAVLLSNVADRGAIPPLWWSRRIGVHHAVHTSHNESLRIAGCRKPVSGRLQLIHRRRIDDVRRDNDNQFSVIALEVTRAEQRWANL
jgi:hypothetical protein